MIFLANRVDITPTTTGSYQDIDVSSYVSGLATGVILHIVNTSGASNWRFAIRKKGGTSDLYYYLLVGQQTWGFTGLDGDKIFQAKVESTDVKIYLIGYFEGEAVFFADPVDKSFFSSEAWTDIDISEDTGTDTAIGAILECYLTTGYREIGYRMNGSTDDRHSDMASHSFIMVGVDANEILEGYQEEREVQTFLVGYLKAGAVFNQNAIDYSLSSTGSWQDLPQLPEGAIGAILEINNSGGIRSDTYGLRKNGSSDDIVTAGQHTTAVIPCDEGRLVEGYIGNTRVDFWLTGYVEEVGPIVYTEDLDITLQATFGVSEDQYGPPVYCVVRAIDVVNMRGVGFTLTWNTAIASAWLQNGIPKAAKGVFLNGGDPSKDDLLLAYIAPGDMYCSLVLLGEEPGVSGSGKLFYVQFERLQAGDPSFSATEIELEADSGSIEVEYSDTLPSFIEEFLDIILTATLGITESMIYRENLDIVGIAVVSVSDTVIYVEVLEEIPCRITVGGTDIQKFVESPEPIIQTIVLGASDIQAYIDDLSIVIASAIGVSDAQSYIEDLQITLIAVVGVSDDLIGAFQEVIHISTSELYSVADLQNYVESLPIVASAVVAVQDEIIGVYSELLDIVISAGISVSDDLITPGIYTENLDIVLIAIVGESDIQPIQSEDIDILLDILVSVTDTYYGSALASVVPFKTFSYKKQQLTFYIKQ